MHEPVLAGINMTTITRLILLSLPAIVSNCEELNSTERKVIMPRFFGGQPIPKWQNGFFLAHDLQEPKIYIYNREGREVFRATVNVPESIRTIITDVSISMKGKVAASGTVASADGASAAFISWFDESGGVARLVRTSPFAPLKITFASDDTLWAFGREHDLEYKEKTQYDMLKQYDPSGWLIRTALPRSSFASTVRPHPAATSFLVASADRLGVYSTPAKEWVEISSSSGEILARWPGVDARKIGGVGLTQSGMVYVSGIERDAAGKERSLFYRLDKTTKVWIPVTTTFDPSRMIFGTDGTHLVVTSQLPELLWIQTP